MQVFSDMKGSTVPIWQLFESRINNPARAKAQLPFIPLADSLKAIEIEALLSSRPVSDDRVLYIHIPFCRQNCSFCGYYKEIRSHEEVIDRYISKLSGQLKKLNASRWFSERPFQAVYFGGGSPSSLSLRQISALLEAIRQYVPVSPETEMTMELTVRDITPELVNHLVSLGINRVSTGVQSFNTELRRNVGRVSSGEQAIDAINTCVDSGIVNLCIDLIYNLPGQKFSHWETDLKTLAKLPVTGCSVYPLIPFPNSSLVRSGGFIAPFPEEDYRYFKLADDHLTSLDGWTAFSPVQYGHRVLGKPGYIMAQSCQNDMLALGPSSGGRISGYQYLSKFSIEDYLMPDFDLLQGGTWSVIDPGYLNFRHLYALSEGQGITEKAMKSAQVSVEDLLPGHYPFPLYETVGDFCSLTQEGRYWAGNLSVQITEGILKLMSRPK